MIPFASQRGGGQDLATHLLNAHDNEVIEVVELRGAVARDLHGAFAEWEAQAAALTNCRQYLCSLSINPDELQGRLTRHQYIDYIARAENRLGLTGQPRAVVFHIKQGDDGNAREHCHVIWSRIDVKNGRAVNLSYFKDKLMTVTREFARDHHLKLPAGYVRHEEEYRRNRQLSWYDGVKQKATGITHEQRMAVVTAAWQRSDNARAFVNALEEAGYILARGRNKTRVVLVDIYGHVTALTRLIDDPGVKAKDVRTFLGEDYAADKLPSVEEAKNQAAARLKAIEDFETARGENEQTNALIEQQAVRRAQFEKQLAQIKKVHHEERLDLAAAHKTARQKQKSDYLAAIRRIRLRRARRRPRGLAAFLGRVTGVTLITKKVHRYRDHKRYEAYLADRTALKRIQQRQRDALVRRHKLQAADLNRNLRALRQIEQRERATVEQSWRQLQRRRINDRHDHMPPIASKSEPDPVVKDDRMPLAQAFDQAAQEPLDLKLARLFGQAVTSGEEQGEADQGSSGSLAPASEREPRCDGTTPLTTQLRHQDEDLHDIHERLVFERERLLWHRGISPVFNRHADPHNKRGDDEGTALNLTKAFAQAAAESGEEGKGGEDGGEDPKPASQQKTTRRRRRRRKRKKRDEEQEQGQQQRRRRRRRDLDRGA